MNLSPIGVFDSGVGGLSVWRCIVDLLPAESTIYLADQAHVPYGARPQAEIAALTHAAAAWLLEQGVKLVVIACNTASAAALASLRQTWPQTLIVGMEPAIKPATAGTRTGRVGVMATPGTLHADRFHSLVERFAGGVEVHTSICPGLVEWVEQGRLAGPEVEALLRRCLAPLLAAGIDQLVLGCTHYPFLLPAIQAAAGAGVTLIDPAPAVARQVQRRLAAADRLAPAGTLPRHDFYTTAEAAALQGALRRLLGLSQARAQTLTPWPPRPAEPDPRRNGAEMDALF